MFSNKDIGTHSIYLPLKTLYIFKDYRRLCIFNHVTTFSIATAKNCAKSASL